MDIHTRAGAMNTTMKRLLWLMAPLGGVAHANTVTYIYTDPQGTPLAEANTSGVITATFDYAPYGNQAMGAAHDGPGYTGHVNDADTGLVYMQARYYDPAVGRFISTDPDGLAAGNPFNFNRFAYANNNPVANIDLDGRQTGSLTHPDVKGVAGPGYVMDFGPSGSKSNGRKDKSTPVGKTDEPAAAGQAPPAPNDSPALPDSSGNDGSSDSSGDAIVPPVFKLPPMRPIFKTHWTKPLLRKLDDWASRKIVKTLSFKTLTITADDLLGPTPWVFAGSIVFHIEGLGGCNGGNHCSDEPAVNTIKSDDSAKK